MNINGFIFIFFYSFIYLFFNINFEQVVVKYELAQHCRLPIRPRARVHNGQLASPSQGQLNSTQLNSNLVPKRNAK